MSDCLEAPDGKRRETNQGVKFTVHNPEALFRPEIARAVLNLLRSPNRHPQPMSPAGIPDRNEVH